MVIDHIAMYVKDLEKARDFFVKYLDGKSNDGYHNKTTDFRSYVEDGIYSYCFLGWEQREGCAHITACGSLCIFTVIVFHSPALL